MKLNDYRKKKKRDCNKVKYLELNQPTRTYLLLFSIKQPKKSNSTCLYCDLTCGGEKQQIPLTIVWFSYIFFPQNVYYENSERTAKLEEFYSEHSYTHHLNSTYIHLF